MKDLKSLLFKKADNIYADVLIQSLEEFIQNGNNVTKEQFEEFLNVIPKELLNEDVDINTAYSQFITEFVKKNNTSSKHNDKQENKDSQKMDDQNKISKVFYAQIEKICLNQNLTFTQTIHQLTQLKEDYQNQYGENFALVEEQVNIVDELIHDVQNTIQTGLQKVKKEIDDDIQIQSLDTSDLEKKLFEMATKNMKVDGSDKITDALLEKGKAQIVDMIIRDIRPIEGIKRAIQDVKMDSTLREIEKINKILQMIKPYEKTIPEFEEEKKKLEGIKKNYSQRKTDFSNRIFMEKAKSSANQDRKKVIEIMDKNALKVLDKKFTKDKLKTDKYKNLLAWDNVSKLVDELKEDIIKNSNLEGISEIKKIETYIRFYEDELEKNESTETEIQNMQTELDKLINVYQSYADAKDDISHSIRKAIDKDESFENLNARGKKRKLEQLIDGNLKLYDAVKNFERWDNPKKLKDELKNDIQKEALTPKKVVVENKGKDINKWKKALVGGLGFAAGIGLEIVLKTNPVLGTVATAYTLARTVYNASKLTCSISTKINKENEPKIISGIKSVIPAKVQNIAKTIFEKPNNPYFRSFVNGLSLGYTSANIYQRFIAPQPDTTVTVIDEDKLTAPTPTETPTPTPSASVTEAVTTTPKITTTPTATVTTTPVASTTPSVPDVSNVSSVNIPTFKTGNVMDISGLEYGYAGPGQPAVHLLNNRGVNAVFDKTNVINGQTWVHFKQANGAGYAWFPKEEVEEMLTSISSGRAR